MQISRFLENESLKSSSCTGEYEIDICLRQLRFINFVLDLLLAHSSPQGNRVSNAGAMCGRDRVVGLSTQPRAPLTLALVKECDFSPRKGL
jgi:hypothetical protein